MEIIIGILLVLLITSCYFLFIQIKINREKYINSNYNKLLKQKNELYNKVEYLVGIINNTENEVKPTLNKVYKQLDEICKQIHKIELDRTISKSLKLDE